MERRQNQQLQEVLPVHDNHPHPHMTPEPLPAFKTGKLPERAPLAVPFVPFQGENPPQYNPEEGFTRGTLFPGLDLPFHNTVNKTNPIADTPLGALKALEFAVLDLHLYLDTHPRDRAAIASFEHYASLLAQAKKDYEAEHGPLTLGAAAVRGGHYAWLSDPWPWEYRERMV